MSSAESSTTRVAPAAFKLLEQLERNNNREWYAEHKGDFKRELLEPIEAILIDATRRLARTALPMVGSRKTMFRMHRDTRFSNNKLPYKLNVGGVMTSSGSKRAEDGLLYLHCDATGGFVAAGFYLPDTARLQPVRQRMLDEPKAWSKVLKALEKAGLALSDEHTLKSMPRGFAHAADQEHAASLKLKSLVVMRPLTKKRWGESGACDELVTLAKQTRPLIEFGRDAG